MRPTKTIIGFGLFVALACLAQVPYHNSLVWRANQWKAPSVVPGAPNAPTNIPGMAYWWVASDLPNGIISGGWTDRIQNFVLSNAASAYQPRKVNNWVEFVTGFLTNGPINAGDPWAVGWVSRVASPYNAAPNGQALFSQVLGDPVASFWRFQDSTFFDYLIMGWNIAGANVGNNIFDGVLIYSNTHSLNLYISQIYGGRIDPNATIGLTAGPLVIGNDTLAAHPLMGSLFEFWVYTNVTLGLVQASNLHWYSTNNYVFTDGVWNGSRTNVTGFMSQYVASDYTTNTTPLWPDRGHGGYALTNLSAASTWPTTVANGVNTNTTLSFDGSNDFLDNYSYFNFPNCEYIFVYKYTDVGNNGTFFDGVANDATRTIFYGFNATKTFYIYEGANLLVSSMLTNTWAIADMVFTGGATSTGYTNNIAGATGNAGSNIPRGIRLAASFDKSATFFSKMEVAEILIYRGNLQPSTRTNVYNELKGIYGL